MKKLYTILLFFLILFSLPTGLLAQNFYWEAPVQITAQGSDCRFADVVQAEKKTKNTFLFWQEIDNNKKQIYISMQKSTDGYTWKKKERFCGPFSYSGEVPQIYSASSNDKGRLAIAILSETREITVLFSDDEGETFTDFILQNEDFPLVAPRVYPLSNNEFIVFASLADKEKFNLAYSISKKGKKGVIEWSDFTEFEIKDKKVSNPFVPFIANVGFSGDLLVFQAQYSANNRLSFQIFSSLTKDNGKSWTEPVMLTGNSQTFTSYNNQRPIIYYLGSDVYMAWERSTYGSATSSIYSCTMNSKGQLKNEMAKINTSGNCYRPFFFSRGKDFCLGWTDLQNSMSQVLFSTKRKTFWDEEDTLISRTGSTAIPLICNKGKNISFAWQEKNAKGYSINTVVKDSSTSLPSIKAESFESGKRSAADLARATFIPSDDSSGIKGFSWIFTQDEKEEPPQKLMRIPQESLIEGNATKDGKWYFKVKQIDYADNWSQTAVLTYVKDTTPPLAPKILLPDQDDEGLLQSNTFFVNWQAAEDEPDADDIVGYSWDLDFIVPLERRLCESPRHPLRISKEELKEKNETVSGGDIRLKDVHFSYDKGCEILHGIDIDIPKNGFVGIVGESGSGKSTVASLIMGRNTLDSGSLAVDGKEIGAVSEDSLMKTITYIGFGSVFFKGTVRENLLLADKKASEEKLWRVLTDCNLADFLKNENGLDTELLENAGNLSGGQKQRLALVRAILHDSPVYIFDEATSNIDVESEEAILKQIHALSEEKTVIMISHRLANVVRADRIYCMENGNIAEYGSHEQLIKNNGVYANLWKTQQALENYGKEAV